MTSGAWPRRPEDITEAWLDVVLSLDGTTEGARVASFRCEKIGEAGFIGELVRLTIEYVEPDRKKPASLIAKFSSRDENQRGMFHGIGLYAREVRFYRELASDTPMRTPRCYCAEIDPESGETVLLMEDLAGLRTPDVVAGFSLADVRSLVRALAVSHALWWNQSARISDAQGARIDAILRIWHVLYQASWPRFAERVGELLPEIVLPAEFLEVGGRLCRSDAEVFARFSESPLTWVHMDLHPDNLAFDAAGSPVVFDWQTSGLGRGPVDLAYFAASGLPTELRRTEEAELLALYHAGLQAGGVRDYSSHACASDYARGALWSLLVVAGLVAESVVSTESLRYVAATLPRLAAFLADHEVIQYLDA